MPGAAFLQPRTAEIRRRFALLCITKKKQTEKGKRSRRRGKKAKKKKKKKKERKKEIKKEIR